MIYLDNAATTAMSKSCLKAFEDYGINNFYNPSALYSGALSISNEIKNARHTVLRSLGASSGKIIFTASGSEADNIALLCSIKSKRGKVIVGSVEHSAIFNAANELKNRGFEVIYAPVDGYGKIVLSELEKILDESVVLVSIMHVCNETGAQNDLTAISKLIKKLSQNAIFHSDGVQAFGKIVTNVTSLGVDLYSISGHKLHAPKGIGALYVREGMFLKTFVFGGGQEFDIRSSTENVANIMALKIAVEENVAKFASNFKHNQLLQSHLIDALKSNFDDILIITNISVSAPHIVSCALKDERGEVVLHCLEDRGIIVGTGSACSAKKLSKRIPEALAINSNYSSGMLRISFCEENSIDDVDKFIVALKEINADLKQFKRK